MLSDHVIVATVLPVRLIHTHAIPIPTVAVTTTKHTRRTHSTFNHTDRPTDKPAKQISSNSICTPYAWQIPCVCLFSKWFGVVETRLACCLRDPQRSMRCVSFASQTLHQWVAVMVAQCFGLLAWTHAHMHKSCICVHTCVGWWLNNRHGREHDKTRAKSAIVCVYGSLAAATSKRQQQKRTKAITTRALRVQTHTWLPVTWPPQHSCCLECTPASGLVGWGP